MDIIIIVLTAGILSFIVSIYKVEEATLKGLYRKDYGDKFAFLSSKGYMPLIAFLLLSPLMFMVEWNLNLIFIILGFSILRFIPWVSVNIFRGYYSNTTHQASSNFTMLENFAGPLGALFVFGIYNYLSNSKISLLWYVITPIIGLFLLWALREKEDNPFSKEMIAIILLQALLVSMETIILLYLKYNNIGNIYIPNILSSLPIKEDMTFFMIIIAISSLFSGIYFFKDILSDYKKEKIKLKGFKLGSLGGIHDVFYFIGFAYFGPIFIITRRGLIIPFQNLYINLKNGGKLYFLIKTPFQQPLLTLNGGKDFIISFVDLIFNRVVKVIIT